MILYLQPQGKGRNCLAIYYILASTFGLWPVSSTQKYWKESNSWNRISDTTSTITKKLWPPSTYSKKCVGPKTLRLPAFTERPLLKICEQTYLSCNKETNSPFMGGLGRGPRKCPKFDNWRCQRSYFQLGGVDWRHKESNFPFTIVVGRRLPFKNRYWNSVAVGVLRPQKLFNCFPIKRLLNSGIKLFPQ